MAHLSAEESAEAPAAIAKFSEKKFAPQQYTAATRGKVVFRASKKPLAPAGPLRLTFERLDAKQPTVQVEVPDGEGFLLQAVPGTWRFRQILRAGRLYRTGQQFGVTAGQVVFLGVAEVSLGSENRQGYSYRYRLDSSVNMGTFGRNPEFGKLIAAYAPAPLADGSNVALFAPNYPVDSAEATEPKTLGAAAEHGDLATALELLAAGADPSAPDADGWTPLHSALRFGHPRIAAALLDRGSSLTAGNPSGWTPLMFALRYGPAELATRMIEAGAEPDRRNDEGWTPLMFAVRNDQPDNALLLMKKGARIDERTKDGKTALMLAAGFAQSVGRHTFELAASAGGKLGNDPIPIYDRFELGGFLRLSGLAPGQLRTDASVRRVARALTIIMPDARLCPDTSATTTIVRPSASST